MDSLTKQLQEANNAYHNGTPIMTDDEYDALVEKWEDNTKQSWSDYIGVGALPTSGAISSLPMWMGSMNKVKEEKDITNWIHKWQPTTVLATDKLDGISCLFEWIPSRKTYTIYTRGNGKEGTDITGLVDIIPSFLTIKSIIKRGREHNGKNISWLFHMNLQYFIRGELVIPRQCWLENKDTIWKDYQNPRNTVAGLVSRKLSSLTHEQRHALSQIHFVPFSIDFKHLKNNSWHTTTKEKMFQYINSLRTYVSTQMSYDTFIPEVYCSKLNRIDKTILSNLLEKRRKQSPYDIDGIVVWDNKGKHEPNSSGNPAHAFAFKMIMEDQQAETLVQNVEWNLSRQNVWKPVVIFNQITIGGTNISRATGHNAQWLIERGIGVGSRIKLIRSGDVIPKIHDVITKASTTPMPPDGQWEWDANHTDVKLKSGTSVLDHHQISVRSHYLVSTLRAKGLSIKNLEKFVEKKYDWVKSLQIPHLFPLVATNDMWLEIDGVKDKSATKFVEVVVSAWNSQSIPQKVVALGVLPRGIGIKQVESLERNGLLDRLLMGELDEDELMDVAGLGSSRVNDILCSQQFVKRAYSWASQNTPRVDVSQIPQQQQLSNMSSVIATIGDKPYILLTGFRNEILQKELELKGKTFIKSLGKKHTGDNTVVITQGDKTNGKIQKGESIGIPVIRI